MLRALKQNRDLTVFLTAAMDEADKLCDRIALVDHGKLVALDSPMKLKASISGTYILEVSFPTTPPGWEERMRNLPEVESVSGHDNLYRIATRNGPATTMPLLEAAAQINLPVLSLSVQSTTLDDVFVHYRTLRDASRSAAQDQLDDVRRG